MGELFHGDPLVEGMLRIEQQGEGPRPVQRHIDRADLADLELVGDRSDRALVGFQDAETDRNIVGQDRTRPRRW